MLDRINVRDRADDIVRQILTEHGFGGPIDAHQDLRGAGLNSMAMVKLMLAVELAFDVTIPDSELLPENFSSVHAIERMAERLLRL
jgi:acyl carrier protein